MAKYEKKNDIQYGDRFLEGNESYVYTSFIQRLDLCILLCPDKKLKQAICRCSQEPLHAVQFIALFHTALRYSRRKLIRNENQNRHPITSPHGRALGCPLLGFGDNWPLYNGTKLYL